MPMFIFQDEPFPREKLYVLLRRWRQGGQYSSQGSVDGLYQGEFSLSTELPVEVIHVERPEHPTTESLLLHPVSLAKQAVVYDY